MTKKINLIKVESSNIDKVGYEGDSLYVLFKNKGLYEYSNVGVDTFNQLLQAESVGKYFIQNVKKVNDCKRIWDDDPFYIENVESEE